MTNNQTCKKRVAHSAAKNSARHYLVMLSPAGADLVLLFTLEVLLWIA
ncbi:hypothetical protein [Pseudomonas sp. TMP25]